MFFRGFSLACTTSIGRCFDASKRMCDPARGRDASEGAHDSERVCDASEGCVNARVGALEGAGVGVHASAGVSAGVRARVRVWAQCVSVWARVCGRSVRAWV